MKMTVENLKAENVDCRVIWKAKGCSLGGSEEDENSGEAVILQERRCSKCM